MRLLGDAPPPKSAPRDGDMAARVRWDAREAAREETETERRAARDAREMRHLREAEIVLT